MTRLRAVVLGLLIGLACGAPPAAAQGTIRDADTLRQDVLRRFDVVPLRQGVALASRTRDVRVEIADGLVLAGGRPLAGAEVRERLGPDASLVLRLSYLSNADLRTLFAPPPDAPVPPEAPEPPAAAPAPPTPPAVSPPAVSPPSSSERTETPARRRTGARLALGRSVVVSSDEEVTDGVVVLGGSLRVDGTVRDDIVVVGGHVELTPGAQVGGDITTVGGQVTIAPGARHRGRVRDAAIGPLPDWHGPLIWWPDVRFGGVGRWLTLLGTLARVGILAVLMAIVVLAARAPVSRIGAAAAAEPWRAAFIGLFAQALFLPLLVVITIGLAITIIGLPLIAVVVPLALLLFFLTLLVGFTSLATRTGEWLESRVGWRVHTGVLAALLGLLVVVLPTLV
jgi:hypothetical protein